MLITERNINEKLINFNTVLIAAGAVPSFKDFIVSKRTYLDKVFTVESNKAMKLTMEVVYSNNCSEVESFIFHLQHFLKDAPNLQDELTTMYLELNSLNDSQVKTYKEIFKIKIHGMYIDALNKLLRENEITVDEFTSSIADLNSDSVIDMFDDPNFVQTLDLENTIPEELEKDYISDIIKTPFECINKSYPEGGIIRGQLGVIMASPGVGKTLWLLNLTSAFVMNQFNPQNLRVIYFVLGDMNKYNLTVRLISICLNISQYEIRQKGNFSKYYKQALMKFPKLFDNTWVRFVALKPGKFTAQACHQYMKRTKIEIEDPVKGGLVKVTLNDLFDIKIFDYDGCFASTTDLARGGLDLYISGGETYNELKTMAETYSEYTGKQSLVLVATQPKLGKANHEDMGIDDMSESAQKQRVIDFMFTLASPYSWRQPNFCGIMRGVKGRNADLFTAYYLKDFSGRFIISTESTIRNIVNQSQLSNRYTAIKSLIATGNYIDIKDTASGFRSTPRTA